MKKYTLIFIILLLSLPCKNITAQVENKSFHKHEIGFSITGKGAGNIIIQASELQAGMYMYTLLVNNTIVDSKRMILTK